MPKSSRGYIALLLVVGCASSSPMISGDIDCGNQSRKIYENDTTAQVSLDLAVVNNCWQDAIVRLNVGGSQQQTWKVLSYRRPQRRVMKITVPAGGELVLESHGKKRDTPFMHNCFYSYQLKN